jgi:hypothetical protein
MDGPRLTKEAILEGTKAKVTLKVEQYGANVVIRPLTDGELTKIFSIVGSLPLKEDGTPDLSKIDVTRNFEALRHATAMGLDDPKLTLEEIEKMKFGVPEYIGMKVLELSGVTGADISKKKGDK